MKLKDYRIAVIVFYYSCRHNPEHCTLLVKLIEGDDPMWAEAARREGIVTRDGKLVREVR